MTVTEQQAAWPEGVIARYLTVGGGTVDITETGPREARDSEALHVTVATCSGCPATERLQWEGGFYDYSSRFHSISREEAVERAEAKARKWAQAHADTCRAMPRPGGE